MRTVRLQRLKIAEGIHVHAQGDQAQDREHEGREAVDAQQETAIGRHLDGAAQEMFGRYAGLPGGRLVFELAAE